MLASFNSFPSEVIWRQLKFDVVFEIMHAPDAYVIEDVRDREREQRCFFNICISPLILFDVLFYTNLFIFNLFFFVKFIFWNITSAIINFLLIFLQIKNLHARHVQNTFLNFKNFDNFYYYYYFFFNSQLLSKLYYWILSTLKHTMTIFLFT